MQDQSHVSGSGKGSAEVAAPVSPARKFEAEAQEDTIQDIGFVGMGVPAAFFTTMETVRKVIGPEAPRPSYRGWYQYILRNMGSLSEDEHRWMTGLLRDYAEQSDSLPELGSAMSPLGALERRLHRIGPQKVAALVVKILDRRRQVKTVALRNGRSDIHVAAMTYDVLLGADGLAVHRGECAREDAWSALKERAGQATARNQE